MRRFRRLFPPLAALVLLTGADPVSPSPAPAPEEEKSEKIPMASSGIIESFKIPERDGQGNLLWLIQGQRAQIIQEGRIQIYHVQLDTYRKGQVDQTLKSSECFLIRQTENGKVTTHAESTNNVEIVGKNIVITADGFKWFPEQARLVMEKNVQVVFERKAGSSILKNS